MAASNTDVDGARWLTPDELQTWRALSVVMVRLPTKLGAQLQSDAGLSFVEYYVLAALSDSPNRTMRMSRLAVLANSELSRLSHLLRRLEKRGFVRREPDPADGRVTNAILTDAGYEHLAAEALGHVRTVRRLVFDVLTEPEQHALRHAATKIIARVDSDDAPSDDSVAAPASGVGDKLLE